MKFTEIDDGNNEINENNENKENIDKNVEITDEELEKMLDSEELKFKEEDDDIDEDEYTLDMSDIWDEITEEDDTDDDEIGPLERDYPKEMKQEKELEEKEKIKEKETDDWER